MDQRKARLKLPSSTRDILELFTLSRTNQILRGRSPILEEQDEDNKGWTELVASEILSAKIDVVPQPQEFNINLVSSDPRRGRYEVKLPQKHLCKDVRKNIIHGILEKYHLAEAKVDSGKRRKKITRKELEEWKLKRAQGLEGWKKKKGKKRVISTKRRKKFQKYQPCTTCGDYHFKKVCTAHDMKVNLLVRQINQKADIIKENMKNAWDKLDELEATYNGMLMKTHRLQSNRICLEVLSGEPEPGHPEQCPCAENKRIEEARKEKAYTEELIRKRLEKRAEAEKEKARRDELIEQRKKRYYESLKKSETQKETKPKVHDQAALTKLDSKRSSRTLDQVSEISREFGKPLDLVIMDGAIKSLAKEYVEEGGMIFESIKVDSLPDYMEKQVMDEIIEEDRETLVDEELKSLISEAESEKEASEEDEEERTRTRMTADSMPFDKFLDFMEIF